MQNKYIDLADRYIDTADRVFRNLEERIEMLLDTIHYEKSKKEREKDTNE